jgi:hypothetical protein
MENVILLMEQKLINLTMNMHANANDEFCESIKKAVDKKINKSRKV